MKSQRKMKLSNRFSYLLVGAITLAWACLAPPAAHAKDKLIMSMVNKGDPGASSLFVGCQSSGLVKMIGPKIQILLKKLDGKPSGDGLSCSGDDVICIVRSNVNWVAGTPFVSNTILRGDTKRGNMKIKVDTCDENPALCAIPALDVRITGTTVTCYEGDPTFVTPTFTGGPLNNCEGVVLGEIDLPSSPVIAETGMMGTCDD